MGCKVILLPAVSIFYSHLCILHSWQQNNELAKPNPAYDSERTPAWAIIKRKNNFLFRAALRMSTRINIGFWLFIESILSSSFVCFCIRRINTLSSKELIHVFVVLLGRSLCFQIKPNTYFCHPHLPLPLILS